MAPLTLTIIINQTNVYHIEPQSKGVGAAIASAVDQFYQNRDRYAVIGKEKKLGADDVEEWLTPENDPYWSERVHTINVVESTMQSTQLGWND